MRFSWCALMHHNPWRHMRCRSCTQARRLWAAEDFVARRGLTGAAAAAAAANLSELGPHVVNLDTFGPRNVPTAGGYFDEHGILWQEPHHGPGAS